MGEAQQHLASSVRMCYLGQGEVVLDVIRALGQETGN